MTHRVLLEDRTLSERAYAAYRAQGHRVKELIRVRRARRRQRAVDTVLSRVPLDFDVMAYFSDRPVNLYQIRQWLYPLERLDEKHKVFILTRNAATFQALSRETHLPIVNAMRIGTIDSIAQSSDIKMAVYVNQTYRNFHAMRYPEMLHVFLSHGESEKGTYMATNQAKAYDFTFVAGDAAVDRIKANLVRFDWEKHLVKIGRPQLDVPLPEVAAGNDGRTTVLYAPTWEGDRPSMAYGSVESHGRELVRAVLASPQHRLVYRPHPRIGVTHPQARTADRALREMVEAAASQDPTAGHRVDLSPHFGPQMSEADIMVCDVSAVALDFLPTGKPLVVTVPVQEAAAFDRSTFLGSVYELRADDLTDLVPRLDGWLTDDARAEDRARWVSYYFGDITPGASMARFLSACDDVIDLRDRLVAEKRARQAEQGLERHVDDTPRVAVV